MAGDVVRRHQVPSTFPFKFFCFINHFDNFFSSALNHAFPVLFLRETEPDEIELHFSPPPFARKSRPGITRFRCFLPFLVVFVLPPISFFPFSVPSLVSLFIAIPVPNIPRRHEHRSPFLPFPGQAKLRSFPLWRCQAIRLFFSGRN